MEFPRPSRRRARENIVPLVNVVFLLLIFFMLSGTLHAPEPLEVELPLTAGGQPAREDGRVLVLDRHGALAVDGQLVEAEALARVLQAGPDDGQPLRLRVDGRARAEQLLPLLESLEELGFDELLLLTRDTATRDAS